MCIGGRSQPIQQAPTYRDAPPIVTGSQTGVENPKDTKDHPRGVWTLLPNLRLGEEDRDKYIQIGESDRMTLLFTKD